MPFTIFVCYYKEDADKALPLIERLARELPDVKIWTNYDDYEHKNRMEALTESDIVLYACSNVSNADIGCAGMMNYAIYSGKVVIPCILSARSGEYIEALLEHKLERTGFAHSENEQEVRNMISDIRQRIEKWKESPIDEEAERLKALSEIDVVNCTPEQLKDILSDSYNKRYVKIYDDYEVVDLCLPSGVKWATCNLGTKNPEDRGYYFAWGEKKPKPYYSEKNSFTLGKSKDWLLTNFMLLDGNLAPMADAAFHERRIGWRIPTRAEVQDLIDNTISFWTTHNGVEGRIFISKMNKSHIFIPASGYRKDLSLCDQQTQGFYWTASMEKGKTDNASCFHFDSEGCVLDWQKRYYGFPIRPVYD